MEGVRRNRSADIAVITSAPRTPSFEFNQRRRRYTVMMALRVVCLIGAALIYTFSIWFALALIAGGAILPWCAVLIANDGPPKSRRERASVTAPPARELPAAHPQHPDRTIDY
jgi:small neutral amino acid transporter SnatA (MarC family)